MASTLKIKWSFNAQIDGGPQLSESKPVIEASAYDYIKETLPAAAAAGPGTITIHLQPNTDAVMIAITADKYLPGVNYRVDAIATDRFFDAPHVFLGAGAVAYLGSASPELLTFRNPTNEVITVQVLVGRPA